MGKHGAGPMWSQDAINARLIELAQAGNKVVRLKGGDPAVFARTAEELEMLARAHIPFEVVPGITAALAAASYVGIPITHRDHASAVAFITGQQQDECAQDLDWQSLARFPGTLVFYMGVTTAGQWTQRLLQHGMAPDTPAAIVRRCSWRDQKVIRCQLDEVAEQLTPASKLRPPVIVIIGQVAKLGSEFNWFDAQPLRNVGVWVTRPMRGNSHLESMLLELGADVYTQPGIETLPVEDSSELDKCIAQLSQHHYQAVAFTSAQAIDSLLNRIWELGLDQRVLANTQLVCVGAKTATHLHAYGLRADVVPQDDYSAEAILRHLKRLNEEQAYPVPHRWLLPQADQARDTLAVGLEAMGADVDRVIAYRTQPIVSLSPEIQTALEQHAIDWVTITSPSIAKAVHSLIKPYTHHVKPISLSPAISQTLQELGWPAGAQAQQATEESLVEALLTLPLGAVLSEAKSQD